MLIDAGSAVTIDLLDNDHVFRGGLIAPGLDLMAKALNSYTALLPIVEVKIPIPSLPADRTVTAMQAGIFLCLSACIRAAVSCYAHSLETRVPCVFFTGGQAEVLIKGMGLYGSGEGMPPTEFWGWKWWPEQTLAGILYAAEALP